MKLERYSRQILYPNIGEKGQKRLLESKLVLIGCGALGSSSANLLVRAGIGHLLIVDRDRVETSNLQRQTLFNEEDARQHLPKAQAAQQKLAKINSEITIEAHILDVHAGNIESLISECNLILDGTDNFETRYLINDVSLKYRIPWIYGGCVKSRGSVMTILPDQTPCLRCVFESPPIGPRETADTVGIIGPIAQIVSALQVTEVLKVLTGRAESGVYKMLSIEAWDCYLQALEVTKNPLCPACGQKRFEFLH